MSQHLLRCVWPVIDESLTRTQLIAEAVPLLPDIAAAAGAIPTTAPVRWEIRDASDVEGWEYYPGCLLVAEVAADIDHDKRRELLARAADEVAEVRAADLKRAALDESIRELHARGLGDGLIAVQLNVHRRTVVRTRERLSLPANFKPGGRRADRRAA